MRVLEELTAVAIDLGRHEHGADLLATARRARLDEDKPLSPAWRTEVDGLVAQVGTRHGTPLGTRRAVALAHSLAGNGRS